MNEQRSCFLHGNFDGARCQECADAAFESALKLGDHTQLAIEIEARLRAAGSYGISLRRDPHGPFVWRRPLWIEVTEPPWKQWAEEAAAALIGGAS